MRVPNYMNENESYEWWHLEQWRNLENTHVRVVTTDDTVFEGALKRHGQDFELTLSNGTVVKVISRVEEKARFSVGIKEVYVLWDEEVWNKVPADEVGRGDVVPIGGELFTVVQTDHKPGTTLVADENGAEGDILTRLLPFALRSNLPTENGFYKDRFGEYWACNDSVWVELSKVTYPDVKRWATRDVTWYAPFRPIHFEPGKELWGEYDVDVRKNDGQQEKGTENDRKEQ